MSRLLPMAAMAACIAVVDIAHGQLAVTREEQVVQSASAVLNEIMAVPVTRIPQNMLEDAKGVAIVPNVIKGGFVVGVRHGRGVVLVRDEQNGWQPPQFVSLTGGSLGWQAGVQATDVILVFKTQKSVQGLLNGKFTLGVDAAAAAGPVGREAAAATDASLKAEIYSYSRSRGLFAGVSLDGSALQMDPQANQIYYRTVQQPGPAVPQIPASAVKLIATLTQYSQDTRPMVVDVVPAPGAPTAPMPMPTPAVNPDSLKTQLVEASRQLSMLIDPTWQQYLALPAEIYTPMEQPSAESLAATMTRFDRVAQDARYRALTQRGEFRSLHELLRKYQQTVLPPPASPASLPPPPVE